MFKRSDVGECYSLFFSVVGGLYGGEKIGIVGFNMVMRRSIIGEERS